MSLPKVLVGSPVSDLYDYCFDKFVASRKRLTYPNHDLFFVDNSKTDKFFKKIKHVGLPATRIPWVDKARLRMINSRNLLRQKVLDEGYDYFLNLDQDIIPPDDVVERLIKLNKDVVTGIYFNPLTNHKGEKQLRAVICIKEGNKLRYINNTELSKPNLLKVHVCGTGCILIHRRVLEKIMFRYDPDQLYFDDSWFVIDAYDKGFEVYADTSTKCQHLVLEKPWDWGQLLKKKTA